MKNTVWNIATDLRNSQASRRNFIFQSKTKLITAFLNILWDEGFILGYKICDSDPNLLKIFLKYKNNKPVIKKIKNLSKSGLRMYYSNSQIWKLETSKFFLILSTNQGLKTIAECKKLNMGGEPFIIVI